MEKRKGLQAALSYLQQGKLDQAVAEYQAILRTDPNNCNVLNALGDLSVRIGNKAEAIGFFKRLGEVYRLDGLQVRAIAVYKKVLKLDPSHTEASLACAEMYAEQGLTAEAKLQFQTLDDHLVTAGHADDIRQIYQEAGALLRSQRRGAEATLLTERLASLDPSVAAARLDEALAAAFPGGENPPEPAAGAATLVEEAPSLQILPGPSEVREELQSLTAAAELGGWFDGARGGG